MPYTIPLTVEQQKKLITELIGCKWEIVSLKLAAQKRDNDNLILKQTIYDLTREIQAVMAEKAILQGRLRNGIRINPKRNNISQSGKMQL